MANNAADVDPEKLQAEIEKMTKEIESINADADEICNDIKANAGLKDKIEKILKNA